METTLLVWVRRRRRAGGTASLEDAADENQLDYHAKCNAKRKSERIKKLKYLSSSSSIVADTSEASPGKRNHELMTEGGPTDAGIGKTVEYSNK